MYVERQEKRESASNGASLCATPIRKAGSEPPVLNGRELEGADLERADLRGARFERANLRYACLDWADLTRTNFVGADLTCAQLRGAKLEEAHLARASLVEANLRKANLRGADLRDADIGGAHLDGADLRGTVLDTSSLVEANLRGARYDDRTCFPRGFDASEAGMKHVAARRQTLVNSANRRIRARAFVRVCRDRPVIVMDVTGPVCAETVGYVRDRFEQALWVSRGSAPFLINFDAACRLDADGLDALVTIAETAKRAGVRVGFVVPDRFRTAALEASAFSSIAYFENAKDAIEHVTATAPTRFSPAIPASAISAGGRDARSRAV